VFTFGDIPAYQGDVSFQAAVSDDRRAVTLTFSDVTVALGNSPTDTALNASRSLALVLPLVGGPGRAEIELNLQAGIFLTEGAHATMLSSVNGQSTVADFLVEPEQTFVQSLTLTADTPAECRLFAMLMVGRDSRFPEATVVANLVSIDAEVLPRAPQPPGPGP
jgi:hypothetical protein